jgi:site-specific recombinase XerD
MSVLFNHGIRHEICDRNPMCLVRQSAKRRRIPVVLTVNEVRRLLSVLPLRERTRVLLDVGTGLRLTTRHVEGLLIPIHPAAKTWTKRMTRLRISAS